MTKPCIVPKCKTGYKSVKQKTSVFKVPKDAEMRKKWMLAIPERSRFNDVFYVCENHFEKKFLKKQCVMYNEKWEVIFKRDYERAQLQPGAYPTIFNNGSETVNDCSMDEAPCAETSHATNDVISEDLPLPKDQEHVHNVVQPAPQAPPAPPQPQPVLAPAPPSAPPMVAPQVPQVTQSQPLGAPAAPPPAPGFEYQKTNSYPEMVVPGQTPYPSGENVIGSTAIPSMYGMPPSTTTPSPGAPLTHHQERAALQQQLQELFCMPPAPEHQEKIVALQEKLQALQHETSEQCSSGSQCILQMPIFSTSSAVEGTSVDNCSDANMEVDIADIEHSSVTEVQGCEPEFPRAVEMETQPETKILRIIDKTSVGYSSEVSVSIPWSWTASEALVDNKHHVVFSHVVSRRRDSSAIPILTKAVTIDKAGKIGYSVYGRKLEPSEGSGFPLQLENCEDVPAILLEFEKKRACEGVILSGNVNVQLSAIFESSDGIWHSKNCTLITKGRKCVAYKDLLQRVNRSERRAKNKRKVLRAKACSNPLDERKRQHLQKQLRKERQRKLRAAKKVASLKKELEKKCDEMRAMASESVETKLNECHNVSPLQRTAVMEIFSAAKRSKRGRRYSNEWLMLCMLLSIRSPACYDFLRENAILPLPCRRTIRGYCSSSDFTCGFDENFAKLLKKQFSSKTNLQRSGIIILRDALKWLNDWELAYINKEIPADEFLTLTSAHSLRLSLQSTIDMCSYLIDKFDFKYLLSGKVNQDNLEKFFGTIRQAAGGNEHPNCPTFLQLYKLLSKYSIIKPPKAGNCTIDKSTPPELLFTISDFKELFGKKVSRSTEKLKEMKAKIDDTLKQSDWEAEDIFKLTDHDYALSDTIDCIIYYVTGYLCKQLLQKYHSCTLCRSSLTQSPELPSPSQSYLTDVKSRGRLIHPNIHLFNLISFAETCFTKYCALKNVFDLTVDDILEHYNFTLPCEEHGADVLSFALHYYIRMRMRQYSHQVNLSLKQKFVKQKKLSKLNNQ